MDIVPHSNSSPYQRSSAFNPRNVETAARTARAVYDYVMPNVKKAINDVRRQMVATNLSGPVRSPVAGYAISSGARRKANKGRQRNRQLPGSAKDSIVMKFRSEVNLNNTAANVHISSYGVQCTGSGSFGVSIVKQLSTMASLYREFRIRSIKVSFVPIVGYTTVGQIAVGVDEDPRATSAATALLQIQQISRLPFYLLTDVKEPGTFTWYPKSQDGTRWRYTTESSRPVENLSHGVLLVGCTNGDSTTTTGIGAVYFDVVVEYRFPF